MRIDLRAAFGVAAVILVAVTGLVMIALPWTIDALITALAVISFVSYLERDEPEE